MEKSSKPLPKTNTGTKGYGTVVGKIAKMVLGNKSDMSAAATKGRRPAKSPRKRQNRNVAKPERTGTPAENAERVVGGSTVTKPTSIASGDNYTKKALDIYTNLVNFVKKSVNDLVQKTKTIVGMSKDTGVSSSVGASKSASVNPSIEESRETAEGKEKEIQLESEQVSLLEKIKKVLEKILKKSGGGGEGGGGLLSSLGDVAAIASLVPGKGKMMGALGKKALPRMAGQFAGIAKSGGLAKLANARGASPIVSSLAKKSDSVVRGVGAVKTKVAETATKAAGSVTSKGAQMLGMGTSLASKSATTAGAAGAAGITGAAGAGAAGITGAAGAGAAGATSVAGAAGAAGAAGTAGKSAGFFSRTFSAMGELASAPAALAKAIANPKAFLAGPGGKLMLKSIKGSALISAVLEPLIAVFTIKAIQDDPNMSVEEKKKAIGTELGARLGSGLGAIIGGAVGTLGGPLGMIAGGLVGSLGGEYLGGALVNAIGPTGVYDFAASIPGIGPKIQVEETKPKQDAPTVPAGPAHPEYGDLPSMSQAMQKPTVPSTGTPQSPTPATGSSPVTPSAVAAPSGKALQTQTQQSINSGIQQQAEARQPMASTAPGNTVINNYYNTTTNSSPSAESSAPNMTASPEPSMQSMLVGNVGGVST